MNPFIGGFFDELIKTGGVYQKIRRLRQIANPDTASIAKLNRLEGRYARSVERRMAKPGGFPGDKAELEWHTKNKISPWTTQAKDLGDAAFSKNISKVVGGGNVGKENAAIRAAADASKKQGIFEAQVEAAKRAKKNDRTGLAKLLNLIT
jgi:hypothetical protein